MPHVHVTVGSHTQTHGALFPVLPLTAFPFWGLLHPQDKWSLPNMRVHCLFCEPLSPYCTVFSPSCFWVSIVWFRVLYLFPSSHDFPSHEHLYLIHASACHGITTPFYNYWLIYMPRHYNTFLHLLVQLTKSSVYSLIFHCR